MGRFKIGFCVYVGFYIIISPFLILGQLGSVMELDEFRIVGSILNTFTVSMKWKVVIFLLFSGFKLFCIGLLSFCCCYVMQGGGWCNNVRTCVYRKTTRRGSSKYMEKTLAFTGILSNKPEENPGLYYFHAKIFRTFKSLA